MFNKKRSYGEYFILKDQAIVWKEKFNAIRKQQWKTKLNSEKNVIKMIARLQIYSSC